VGKPNLCIGLLTASLHTMSYVALKSTVQLQNCW